MKTWLVLAAAVSELAAGRGVLWVDGDDVGPADILERLVLLGADENDVSARFAYLRPDEPLDGDLVNDVLVIVRERSCRLAVFDGFNPLLALHGLDPNSGVEVERFYRLIDPIRKAGTANVLTDNVTKSKETRGPWAIGSERKKSKADVHLGITRVVALVRGGTGKATITVHKDRPGHLARPHPGVFVVESSDGTCSWRIDPDDSHDPEGEFRPTRIMEKVSRYLENRPMEGGSREPRSSVTSPGRASTSGSRSTGSSLRGSRPSWKAYGGRGSSNSTARSSKPRTAAYDPSTSSHRPAGRRPSRLLAGHGCRLVRAWRAARLPHRRTVALQVERGGRVDRSEAGGRTRRSASNP